MKNIISPFKGLAALAVITSLFISCEDKFVEPESASGTSIAALAAGNKDLNILVAALGKTNLASTFSNVNSGQFTVFAPTDAAFVAFFQAALSKPSNFVEDSVLTYINNKMTTTSTISISTLAGRLTYHAVSSRLTSDLITGAQGFTTLNGARLSLSKVGSNYLINANNSGVTTAGNGANVVAADVLASNGVVHVIDRVLVPPTTGAAMANTFGITINYGTVPATVSPSLATAEAAADGNANDYDVLVYAIVKSGLVPVLTPNKSPLPDFTFFTPTDGAFYTYITDAGTTVTTDAGAIAFIKGLDAATVADLLKYHVVAGRVLSTDLADGASVQPLLGGKTFTVAVGASVVLKSTGPDATVTTANVLTNAGVVHRINAVLKP